MLSESGAHLLLKRKAADKLKHLGYGVFVEYPIKIGKNSYRVDVVGFKKGRSIAIECGRTPSLKIRNLQKVFDKVERSPYSKRINPKCMRKHEYDDTHSAKKFADGIVAVSTVFQRGKTQVPIKIRKFFGLEEGDTMVWGQEANGRIYVESAWAEKSR